ncbi:MAG: response regulator transcription factor [Chlorobi bacterium]|jgi:DNA-binding response OmpR family regulator|nr:response regulator transcription factor [Chlorobiota bacterium]
MNTILIIEDDPAILTGLVASLQEEHFTVLTATDGITGQKMALEQHADLIVLDLMLPGKNGQEVCREIRAAGITVPVLMLTAKTSETDTVLGLEMGADDYVKKPFSVRELIARIKALLRRTTQPAPAVEQYHFGNVLVDFKGHELRHGAAVHKLAGKEYDVLKYLIAHEGEVVTREMLLNQVWGYERFPTTRTVDNFILTLRKKIEANPSQPEHLLTIHTAGYKFVKEKG